MVSGWWSRDPCPASLDSEYKLFTTVPSCTTPTLSPFMLQILPDRRAWLNPELEGPDKGESRDLPTPPQGAHRNSQA